jgi:hypothetical protein
MSHDHRAEHSPRSCCPHNSIRQPGHKQLASRRHLCCTVLTVALVVRLCCQTRSMQRRYPEPDPRFGRSKVPLWPRVKTVHNFSLQQPDERAMAQVIRPEA